MKILRISLGLLFAAPLARAAPADVSAELAKLTREGKIPALAAAAVLHGKIVAAGATGVRKYGDPTPVTLRDKFHLGSCTKSMTGALAAMLVADGKIRWNSTVAEVFPQMKIDPGYAKATLLEMASNTGGVPHDIPPALWQSVSRRGKSESAQRLDLVRGLLAVPPDFPPGTKNVYSNGGFTIAGAMLEKVSGTAYDKLIAKRLFQPLHLESAGFGAPGKIGKIDQPFPHVLEDGVPSPISPGPNADNPPAITPAGRVHLSIPGFARYASFQLGTAEPSPLDRKSLDFLHTPVPPATDYAVGWTVTKRDWAGGTALTHNGTNTMNYAVMWLAPDKKFAAVAACNIGGDEAAKACDDAVAFLIGKYLTQPAGGGR
jgi:CubicO group peptidase (beta-lactamase class C family)